MRRTTAASCLALVLLASGCGPFERSVPEEIPNTPSSETSGRLQVLDWSVNDGMLSVLVRNETERTLERAEAKLTITDSEGVSYGAGGSVENDLCCTILSLPPDGTFGVYVDLGVAAEDVEDVTVGYGALTWAADGGEPVPTLTVGESTLEPGEDGAEVHTDLVASGDDVPVVAAQAFLTGPDGEFLAVVSGRFTCFTADVPRDVVLELFHPVPEGTTIEEVVAYPVSPAALGRTDDSCSE